jgi:signal transduction histidine kinase
MSWKIRVKAARRFNLRLTLMVTLAAAISSAAAYGLLLASLFTGFGDQDRAELDSRLLSYWAAWQYGGNQAVLDRATLDMKEHGGRPFLLMLDGPGGEMQGALIPGGWEAFNLKDPDLGALIPGSYEMLRDDSHSYALLITGAVMDDGSRLLVGLSTENRQFLLGMYQRNIPLALAAIIIAGMVAGLFSSRRFISPIVRINDEIDLIIVTGELSRRLAGAGTGDQLDELVNRYNRLLDRVESLIGGMKDTLDAVAHDLRTPLTRLRGHAELALRDGRAEAFEEALTVVVEQTDQAGALLSALMDIAEAEQGMLHLNGEPCDLGVLAAEVSEMYSFIAEEKNQTIGLDAPEPVPMTGDPVRLRQILGNLLDNAVKYSPEGSPIEVRCRLEENTAAAEVLDRGPGVPDSEVSKVFERLYRGDRSRGSRGLGLGLSMVKALAEAHGGTVEVLSREGGGSRFRVVFPISSPER